MTDDAPEFTRSPSRLARILGVDPATINRWKHVGLPWREPNGFPVAECERWARERREARERRRLGGDGTALARLRRNRARMSWHRVEEAREKLVPGPWARDQVANRAAHLRHAFQAAVPELARRLAGAPPIAVATALEDAFRAIAERMADADAEVPVPHPQRVTPDLEAEPVVREGETAAAAARRWLASCHEAEGAAIETALARARGELLPLDWWDDRLAERAWTARRTLQGLCRTLAPEFPRMTEAEAAARLRAEMEAVVAHFGRPLPPPPASTPDLHGDLAALEHDDPRDSEGTTDNNMETDR